MLTILETSEHFITERSIGQHLVTAVSSIPLQEVATSGLQLYQSAFSVRRLRGEKGSGRIPAHPYSTGQLFTMTGPRSLISLAICAAGHGTS